MTLELSPCSMVQLFINLEYIPKMETANTERASHNCTQYLIDSKVFLSSKGAMLSTSSDLNMTALQSGMEVDLYANMIMSSS